jgi:hypothetical protein
LAACVALAFGLSVSAAAAQSVQPPNNAPKLEPEQKVLIYQSVSALHKNSAAPPGFRPAVGTQIPAGIDLQPMPGAVSTVIPEVKGMEVAMIEKQVVVVDPKSRTVLAVVTHAE